MPSFAAKRAAHLEYTQKKIDARLARETDRSDFMTQVSIPDYRKFCHWA
jgi:hypothetical protein